MNITDILIVDDEEHIRHILTVLLQKSGYHTDQAANGQEALEMLRQRSYDLVLSDMKMPVLGGLGLLKALDEEQIETTVIVMTAFGSLEGAVEAMKAGAYDYISKPFRTDDVLMTLAKAQERERLRRENRLLKRQLRADYDSRSIIGEEGSLAPVMRIVNKVAGYKSTVLIQGESGTGKELVAQALHARSDRGQQPFVAVNCGAIPENLIESELFGHEKGAFTDAHKQRRGLFEEANGSTLFLDEIGELPQSLQVKLLRVLQEDEIRRVGGNRDIKIDVRIIAATVRDLQQLVKEGRFREDLYYRLNVISLTIPPLRDRHDDIAKLVEHFIHNFNRRMGLSVRGVSNEAMSFLQRYSWPGNVRELENTVERAMVLCDEEVLTENDLPARITETPLRAAAPQIGEDNLSVKKAVYHIENTLIRKALQKTGGNRTAAAKLLEISHRALLYKIKAYEIDL